MFLNNTFEVHLDQEAVIEVNEIKYLGIIIYPMFKMLRVSHVCEKVKTNLKCFNYISRETHHAALFYMMQMSHISFCVTVWSQPSEPSIKLCINRHFNQLIKKSIKKSINHIRFP